MKRNHILFDCEPTRSTVSGLYHFCFQLGNALIKQADPAREDLTFYVPAGREQLFGTDQHYLRQRAFHKMIIPGSGKFNVWHSTIQDTSYHPQNNKVKTVLTIHDLNFLVQRKNETGKIKKYLSQLQQNVNRADHIVCISAFTKKKVLECLQTKNKPVDMIYNGCTINEFAGFNEPVYRPFKPFIFALGALVPKKNFHVLPALLKNNDVELVIAGTYHSGYASQILQEAKLYDVEKRVKLLGIADEKNKYWYYKNCHAFVFPSLAEGFGLPLIEAMYYGKPAFVAANTSLPEIGGKFVYCFDNFEPSYMQQVFEEGMQHYITTQPSEQIKQWALRYSWANAGKQYLSIYRSLYDTG